MPCTGSAFNAVGCSDSLPLFVLLAVEEGNVTQRFKTNMPVACNDP